MGLLTRRAGRLVLGLVSVAALGRVRRGLAGAPIATLAEATRTGVVDIKMRMLALRSRSVRRAFDRLGIPVGLLDGWRDGQGCGVVHRAALRPEDGEALTWLLARGCSVETRDATGNTPLHLAARAANGAALEALDRAGASWLARNDGQDTPLGLLRRSRPALALTWSKVLGARRGGADGASARGS